MTTTKNLSKSATKQTERKLNPRRSGAPQASAKTRLLVMVLGGTLVGLGMLAFSCYQELAKATQREVEAALQSQVAKITGKLDLAQQSAADLAGSVRQFQRMPVKDEKVYRQLLGDRLSDRDGFLALGVFQAPNQLLDRKNFYPFAHREQKSIQGDEALGLPVSPNSDVLYVDLQAVATAEKNYNTPKIDAAQEILQTVQSGDNTKLESLNKGVWLEPYPFYDATLTTFLLPIRNDALKPIGLASADVNVTELAAAVQSTAAKEAGYFALLSEKGNLLAYPPNAAKAKARESYTTVPELNSSWATMQKTSAGTIQTGSSFWEGNLLSHQRLPGTNWTVVAVYPKSDVFRPVLILFLMTSAVLCAILAGIVNAFAGGSRQQLKPILDECNAQIETMGGDPVLGDGADEAEMLQRALGTLVELVAVNEERVREEVTRIVIAQERLNQAKEAEKEAEFLEDEVGGLLEVVSALEEGDLTVQASVSDRATGLVADTLNRLREQLAEIIARVLGTAQQVANGARDLEELAKIVALNTVEQAQSVSEGRALTEQVAESAKISLAEVSKANESLATVRSTVDRGQGSINALTESIAVLQTGTAQIVQRMKTLGEFVGLAEQFVQDQGQIASLTQVLAINATLVAARAAEQRDPRQFIGVAREFEAIAGQVNSLATQTNEGLAVLQQRTAQIQSVVTAIDAEVQSLGGLVAGFTSGVEQSQQAFNSVQSETERVVNVAEGVTESSLEIADAAASTATYMSEIAALAEQTADLTRSTRQQAEQMGTLAQRLLAGIQFFRLPSDLLPKTEPFATLDIPAETARN